MRMSHTPRVSQIAGHLRRYRIVVGIDLSEYSDIVLEHALDQAARHHLPELHFLTVCEKKKLSMEDCKQALWERVYPALETFNQWGSEWRARLHVRRGRPDQQIGALAADINADLIVLGNFGLHNPRSQYKNLPNGVLSAAVCPVMVVGTPPALDTRQCPACHNIRNLTDCERWFCDQHTERRSDAYATTPMTIWSGGKFAVEKAA
jgi:nucleotide-binding universal stress UspA family protein